MRSSSLLALVVTAIATASATAAGSPSHLDTTALLRRQAPGTPQYDCHANCGGVITISRTENYCENSTFTTELEACLECALQYDIWQYYGESVAAAAEACGLDATPLAAANATTNGTATATGSTTSGSGAGPATTTAATTSGGASATAASSGSGSAGAASGTSSAPAATSSFPGAGNQLVVGGGALALVPIGAMLVDWL